MSVKEHLEAFIRHVDKLSETDHYGDDGYTREFQTLKQRSAQYKINGTYSTDEGEKEWNKRKNRFKDILPYDYTRVKLVEVPGVSGSDYINANFLKGPHGQKMYIASQGPLLHTKVDFWRMVWEYDVNVVVMACNEYEGEKLKCARYWPAMGKSEKYGKINVSFENEDTYNNFYIRQLKAEYGDVSRLVCQFHYVGWPDHGTPHIPSVLEMISVMRERQASPTPPIIIHCSAGCGRTGTICAIDYAWHVLKLGLLNEKFSMFDIIDEMRTQRNAIVQTKDQYMAVHHAVRDLFHRHLDVIEKHNYENIELNGQVVPPPLPSSEEYESVVFDEGQYAVPSKIKPSAPVEGDSPTERAIYSTVANLINANQIAPGNSKAPPSPKTSPDPQYVAITRKDYKVYANDEELKPREKLETPPHSPPVCLPHYATAQRTPNRNMEVGTLEAPAPPPRSSSIRRTVSDEPIANHLKPDGAESGDSSNSQEAGEAGNKEYATGSDGYSSTAGSQDGGEVLCDDKPDLLPDLPPPPPRPASMLRPEQSSSTNTQNANHYYNIADLRTNQISSSLDTVASSSPTESGPPSSDLLAEPPPLPPKLSDNDSDEPDYHTVIRVGSKAYPSGPPKPPHTDTDRCKSSPVFVSSPVHSSSHTSSPVLSSSPMHSYEEHRQSPLSYQAETRSPQHWSNKDHVRQGDRGSPMYEVLSKFRSGTSADRQTRQMNRSVDDADDESDEDAPQVPVRLYKTMPHPGKQQRRRRQQQLQLLLQQQQQEQYAQNQDPDRSSPGVVMIKNPAFTASMTQAELSPRLSPCRMYDQPVPPLPQTGYSNDINIPAVLPRRTSEPDPRFQTYVVKHSDSQNIDQRLSNIQLDDPIYGFHGQPKQQQQQQPSQQPQQQQGRNNGGFSESHYKVPSNHYPKDYNRQYSGSPTRGDQESRNLCQHHKSQYQRLPSTGEPDVEFAYSKDDGDYVSLRVKQQQQQQQQLLRQQQMMQEKQQLQQQPQQPEKTGGTDEGAYGYAYVGQHVSGGSKVQVPSGPAPIKPPRRKRRPHSVSAADMTERMENAARQRASVRMDASCEGALGLPDTYQPVEGAMGANSRMTRSSYGSNTSDDSMYGPEVPGKTAESFLSPGVDDMQLSGHEESSAAESMASSVIMFGKKIKRAVMGSSHTSNNHADIKQVHTKDVYFKGKLINFPHRVDRPRRPPTESPYEVPRSTQSTCPGSSRHAISGSFRKGAEGPSDSLIVVSEKRSQVQARESGGRALSYGPVTLPVLLDKDPTGPPSGAATAF